MPALEAPHFAAPASSGRPRRHWPRVLVAALTALVLAGISWSVAAEVRQRASHAAAEATSATIAALLGSLHDVDELGDFAARREAVETADGEVAQALARIEQRRPSALVAALTEAHAGEREMLAALASLTDISVDTLAEWPAARKVLVDAAVARDAATSEMPALEELTGSVDRLVAHVEDLAAEEILAGVTPAVREAAAALSQASSLADLNRAGDEFAATDEALSSHADHLSRGSAGSGTARASLHQHAELVESLAAIAEMRPEDLDDWPGISADASGLVEDLDGSTAEAVREGLAAVDGLVDGWMDEFSGWQAQVREARSARNAERGRLRTYDASMGRLLDEYARMRDDLADFTQDVQEGRATYDSGYDRLWDAREGRVDVLDEMRSLDVPTELRGTHDRIVELVSRAVDAVDAAEDGLDETYYCYYDCVAYTDSAGWRSFLSISAAISTEYPAAVERLETEIAGLWAEIDDLTLPTPPRF